MVTFAEKREALLLAHSQHLINDVEFVLLYNLNTSKNPALPYWKYEAFDLDGLKGDECKCKFRFFKSDFYHLADALNIPA